MSLAPGTQIADRYVVVGPLGKGGMGDVYIARHLFLKQQVALKVIKTDGVLDEKSLARFEREAQIIAKFRGENVARVIDAGRTPGGMPFIAMELLSGEDLDATLRKVGTLPTQVANHYILQVCEGLAEAHAMGIIHRDLKPANLFVTKKLDGNDLIKILDFGISKALPGVLGDTTGGQVTSTSTTIGSPSFMSPEQLRSSRDVDARTDIWALGVIMYRMCTGRLPFEGETVAEIIVKVMTENPPSLRDLAPDVPDALAGLVDGCLAKDRDLRPASVALVANLLAPIVGRQGHETAERISRIMGVNVAFDRTVAASSTFPAKPAAVPDAGTLRPVELPAPPRTNVGRRILWSGLAAALVGGFLWATRQNQQAPEVVPNKEAISAAVLTPSPSQQAVDAAAADAQAAAPAASATKAATPVPQQRKKKTKASTGSSIDDDLFGNRH